MGFPEEIVIAENKKYNQSRVDLLKREAELKANIERIKQAKGNVVSIKRFCEVMKKSLGNLTFEDKRLFLDALGIKVWIKGDEVVIEGLIPMGEVCAFDSVTSRCSGSERRSRYHPTELRELVTIITSPFFLFNKMDFCSVTTVD